MIFWLPFQLEVLPDVTQVPRPSVWAHGCGIHRYPIGFVGAILQLKCSKGTSLLSSFNKMTQWHNLQWLHNPSQMAGACEVCIHPF